MYNDDDITKNVPIHYSSHVSFSVATNTIYNYWTPRYHERGQDQKIRNFITDILYVLLKYFISKSWALIWNCMSTDPAPQEGFPADLSEDVLFRPSTIREIRLISPGCQFIPEVFTGVEVLTHTSHQTVSGWTSLCAGPTLLFKQSDCLVETPHTNLEVYNPI